MVSNYRNRNVFKIFQHMNNKNVIYTLLLSYQHDHSFNHPVQNGYFRFYLNVVLSLIIHTIYGIYNIINGFIFL